MTHKETPIETFKKLEKSVWDEVKATDPMGFPHKLCEAYRIERNKQEAPDESIIKEYVDSTPYYGSRTPEYKEGINNGIK